MAPAMEIETLGRSWKKYRKIETASHLPEEIIEEILSRLAVKSLLRFRCVSKPWRRLIGSERFIKSQLEQSRKSIASIQLILNCNSKNPLPGLKRCSFSSYKEDPSVEPSPFDDPSNDHLMTDTRVVGHCDGLLCILKQPGSLFLWNPSTKISIELPKLGLEIRKQGFGRDVQSGAYKVFVVMLKEGEEEDDENEWIGKVYSSKTNSWKTVEHGSLDLHNRFGEIVNGKIHWPVRSGYIETFDLKSEVFGVIELPCRPDVGVSLWLEPHREGGCLVVVYANNNKSRGLAAWKMKKYGVNESWVKVWVAPDRPDNGNTFMTPVAVIEVNGVVKYSPRENIVGFVQINYYFESLVSPIFEQCGDI